MTKVYNRYIPEDTHYSWVGEEKQQTGQRPPKSGAGRENPRGRERDPVSLLLGGGGNLFQRKGGMPGLLKSLRMEELDSGDILLLLIVLFLLVEGDELELVIALGLVLIMGLGDGEHKE